MKTNKLIAYIMILGFSVITLITISPVKPVVALNPGTVKLNETVLADEVEYFNTITVNFTVTNNVP
jgi:hypothetical protein